MKWVWRGLLVLLVVLVAGFFVMRVPDTDRDEMWAKYGAAPSQAVELADGRTIHLRDEGPRDAPVIVLLHGSNADLMTWQQWAEILREEYRVIRFDQRGHGLTGPAADGDYSHEAFVADVGKVADALDLDTFTLAGNSMGGGIAMSYAMEHPERLDALVLVDAGGADIQREGSGNLAFTLARVPVVNRLAFQIMPRSLVERSLSQSVSNQQIVTREAVDRYWELARYPGNREATMSRFGLGWTVLDKAEVAKVEVPTLVMWGKEDALIPFEAGEWYADTLPNATLIAYDGIGHIPMEEAAERSAGDLTVWLSDIAAKANAPATEPRPSDLVPIP